LTLFRLRFKLSPPAFFGLPEGDRVVVPVRPGGREIVGPTLDTRTGHLVSHGTLSEYRQPDHALNLQIPEAGCEAEFKDNFVTLGVDAPSPQAAYDEASALMETFCQALSTQYGERFSSAFLSVEDQEGTPQRIRGEHESLTMLRLTVFDLAELRARIETAFSWAQEADPVARKALLYFEHACLLHEFSMTLPPLKPHAGFSQALAFLQLFKALTALVGEPGTDRDYQSRSSSLELQKDFWLAKVKPLYTVRCDEDVAHYSLAVSEPGAFLQRFQQAAGVFREALSAYMNTAKKRRGDGSLSQETPPK
jgi:hypothetical protein